MDPFLMVGSTDMASIRRLKVCLERKGYLERKGCSKRKGCLKRNGRNRRSDLAIVFFGLW